MAERLSPRSPFGEPIEVHWPGASLTERASAGVASIAARREMADEVGVRVQAATGLDLPRTPVRAGDDTLAIAWVGHEQWLVSGEDGSLARTLAEALAGCASVTDLSGAWAELRLAGPRARDVLARLCPVDLHPTAFPAGTVARTMMEHLAVQLALLDDAPTFSLLTPSSSARSFRDALVHAATSACGPPSPRAE